MALGGNVNDGVNYELPYGIYGGYDGDVISVYVLLC
jgi:hypothetical protein